MVRVEGRNTKRNCHKNFLEIYIKKKYNRSVINNKVNKKKHHTTNLLRHTETTNNEIRYTENGTQERVN